jgi:membrane-bound serine protease (ClpP class)
MFADTLRKTDGRILEGKVISETADGVVFEISSAGMTLRQRIPRGEIGQLTRPVREGPGYCVIPLAGEFGREITADAFNRALAEAKRAGAKIVILAIDSGGGGVWEKEKVLAAMGKARELEFVAHVKRAISAAAIVALACPTIVMEPEASIGATVIFKVGPDGTPELVEEKWQSALRAYDRAAATMGKRSDLWVRGMTEMEIELWSVEEEGVLRLTEEAVKAGGKLVKPKGRILTLTAAEAQAFGLSRGTTAEVGGIRPLLGLSAWHDAGDAPGSIMVAAARAARQQAAKRDAEAARFKDRLKYMDGVRGDLSRIDTRLRELDAQTRAAMDRMDRLKAEAEAELAAIKGELEAAIAQAKRENSALNAAKARAAARHKAEQVRRKYEPLMEAARQEGHIAVTESLKLHEKRNELLAGVPAAQ